jgi:adenylate cyclase
MSDGTQRRLAAIVSADVVGYSRLMGVDEEGTLAALKSYRHDLIDPKITSHNGRIVKTAGDGLLLEFASVLDAVRCCVEVQQAMAEQTADVPEDSQMLFRVGINIGDIIIDGEDIHGDGVNVAARLEALAEPGGIVLSDDAYRQVRDRLDTSWADGGEHQVKNIARPIQVWRWSDQNQEGPTQAVSTSTPLALPNKPSIAVLPFDNMSSDPEHEYFADGITEDIITELSRFSDLLVIARNSSFTYKGKATRVQDIGHNLGVRYVVEGSVRRAGNRVRVTAQLVEAETENHLWADRYDGELDAIFDLQDNIVQAIVAILPGRLALGEAGRIKRITPGNMAAYDCLLAGKIHHHRFTKEDNLEAEKYLERAIELDPEYASAYAWKACVLGQAFRRKYRHNLEELFHKAVEFAEKAILLDENEVECHRMFCELAMMNGQWEKAEQHNYRAISLNPNHPLLLAQKGELQTWLGRAEEGALWIRKAMRLDRYTAPAWAHLLGRALMFMQQYSEAVAAYQQSPIARFSNYADMAACSAAAGQQIDAAAYVEEVLKLEPDFLIADYLDGLTYKNQVDRDYHRELLRKTGLPE